MEALILPATDLPHSVASWSGKAFHGGWRQRLRAEGKTIGVLQGSIQETYCQRAEQCHRGVVIRSGIWPGAILLNGCIDACWSLSGGRAGRFLRAAAGKGFGFIWQTGVSDDTILGSGIGFGCVSG